eukprot:scaffold93664_cov38-Phaeocystis_antarctica.AAC.2
MSAPPPLSPGAAVKFVGGTYKGKRGVVEKLTPHKAYVSSPDIGTSPAVLTLTRTPMMGPPCCTRVVPASCVLYVRRRRASCPEAPCTARAPASGVPYVPPPVWYRVLCGAPQVAGPREPNLGGGARRGGGRDEARGEGAGERGRLRRGCC